MKRKCNKEDKPVKKTYRKVVSEPEEIQEKETERIVNCSKCGAALAVQGDTKAYMCPVCNSLFRVQTNRTAIKHPSNN